MFQWVSNLANIRIHLKRVNNRNKINAKLEMHFTETFASANKADLLDNKQTLFQFLPCCQAKIIKSTLWETSGLLGTMIDCFKHGNDLSIICAYTYYNHSTLLSWKTLRPETAKKLYMCFKIPSTITFLIIE